MQINNNYQQNFKGIRYGVPKEEFMKVMYKRMPKIEVDRFIRKLEKSPVETKLGFADKGSERLDAVVMYNNPKRVKQSEYIEENKLYNLLHIKPRNFVRKVLLAIESTEETFQIGSYAKQ